MEKGSRLYSVLRQKCPRCHEGEVFLHPNPYRLKDSDKMHKSCKVCGMNYNPEPGFYFGASYVSYALTVGMAIGIFLLLFPFLGWDKEWIYISTIGAVILITLPVTYRLSRIIWLNFFFGYKSPEQREKEKAPDFPDMMGK